MKIRELPLSMQKNRGVVVAADLNNVPITTVDYNGKKMKRK